MSAAQQQFRHDISALTPPPDEDKSFAMAGSPATNLHTPGGIVSSCPDCGTDIVHPYLKELQEAQARVSELERQIRVLTLRATDAMEKATEYETSLKRMGSLSSAGRSTPEPGATRSPSPAPPRSETPTGVDSERATSRLARLLPTRMPSLRSAASSPSLAAARKQQQSPPPPPPPPPRAPTPPDSQPNSASTPVQPPAQFPMLAHTPPTPTVDAGALMNQLDQEQRLRRAAEADANKTRGEIEELTGQLFEQANQMVAQERKARARLEARVEILERRDGEKTQRLGVLETRIQRVERIRGLLAESHTGNSLTRAVSVDRAATQARDVGVTA